MTTAIWDAPGDHDAEYDAEYLATRDREWRKDIRDLVDSLWARYQPYCGDPDFVARVRREFVPLTWQMYVGVCLLEAGLTLEKSDAEGPDHKISVDGRRIWVECRAVGPGEGKNAAIRTYGNADQQGAYRPPPDDKLEPRITGAIWDKVQKHREWVDAGIVAPEDPYIIAVYTGTIPDADEEIIFPRIVNLMYGLDGIGWEYEVDSEKPVETVPLYRSSIDRPGKQPISRRGFVDPELTLVSAAIVSNHGAYRPARALGRDLVTVHNLAAANPIPRGLIRLGREYWATAVVEHADHRPELPEEEISPELRKIVEDAAREGRRRDEAEFERDRDEYEQYED